MNDATDIELPQALIERLTKQDRSITTLTPQVDRTIAAAAQAQFSARDDVPSEAGDVVSVTGQIAQALPRDTHRSARRARKTAPWGIAAAAAATLAFVVVTLRDPALPGDYDGSGTVDVLDAFALTRELAEDPRFAANDTVDALMQRIVALDGGPR